MVGFEGVLEVVFFKFVLAGNVGVGEGDAVAGEAVGFEFFYFEFDVLA